jgi:hypothetical protein
MFIALALGRSILHDLVYTKFSSSPLFTAIQKSITRESFKITVLLRVTPLVPFGACNYLLSLSAVPTRTLVLATGLGNFPGATIYSLVGSMAMNLEDVDKTGLDPRIRFGLVLFGGVSLIWSVVYISTLAKRELRIALDVAEERVEDVESDLLVRIDERRVDHSFNYAEMRGLRMTGGLLVFGLVAGMFLILLLL